MSEHAHAHSGGAADADQTEQFWEQHYQQRGQVWSGRANPVLVEVVQPLRPGHALDLGCGEGGDAVCPELEFPSADEVLESLELPPGQWRVERADMPQRDVTGPDGRPVTLADAVVAARRTTA